jgi:RHS repeat-associated protein
MKILLLSEGVQHDATCDGAATGLCHTPSREYSPSLGRWMQMDPVGHVEGNDLYASFGDEPTASRDPKGLYTLRFEPSPKDPELGYDGEIRWRGKWVLDQKAADGGWVIQKISITFSTAPCSCIAPHRLEDKPGATTRPARAPTTQPTVRGCKAGQWDYWEAWPVEPGARESGGAVHEDAGKGIVLGGIEGRLNTHLPGADRFTHGSCGACTFGLLSWSASASFYSISTLPAGFKFTSNVQTPPTLANDLPNTTSDPSSDPLLKDGSNAVKREMRAEWNSCDGKSHKTTLLKVTND